MATELHVSKDTQEVHTYVRGSDNGLRLATALAAQRTMQWTLQNAAVADGNGTEASADGYNGTLLVRISNGAGTTTAAIQGALEDLATANSQNIETLGVYLLWDSTNGANTSRTIVSGVVSVSANRSYVYALADPRPFIRAALSSSAALGAGTSVTGCTVTLYGVPD